jgi:hypothetical protein
METAHRNTKVPKSHHQIVCRMKEQNCGGIVEYRKVRGVVGFFLFILHAYNKNKKMKKFHV